MTQQQPSGVGTSERGGRGGSGTSPRLRGEPGGEEDARPALWGGRGSGSRQRREHRWLASLPARHSTAGTRHSKGCVALAGGA